MKYQGLQSKEIIGLQNIYGKNLLPSEKTISIVKIFLLQFVNPLVYLLLGVGVISLFLQKYTDLFFMFLVILINSLFGFFQEYKTQKTLLAIKKLIKPITTVFRDGIQQKINVADLVPGDIVVLNNGDKIPADGEILECFSFFINEAVLTGESEAVEKKVKDEIYMGTIVVGGRSVMRVTKTGLNTSVGKVAQIIKKTIQPQTTLQTRLKKFTHTLIYISIFLSLLVFVMGYLIGNNFWQMVQISAVVLVAIIPEALIIVVTLILAIAMHKISIKKAVIRKLLAIETLGSTTVICADKTGTLTEGKMEVDQIDFTNRQNCLLAICLCNDLADTAELAMWNFLKKQKEFPFQQISDKYNRIFEIPFGSEHKFMATVNEIPSSKENIILVKGAPEIVLRMSNLSKNQQNEILSQINQWAEKGLKVFGLAYKKIPKNKDFLLKKEDIPKLEWGGLMGLWDPPRLEVKEALQTAKQAGIKVKIVTGDYRITAKNTMNFLGINVKENEILDGDQIEKMSDSDLRTNVSNILLFARVTPNQKLRIVKALQDLGEIVAMTGDGVNDAPALKKSNIGIVMGDSSEVAKETADLVLVDNNFGTIITAIEEGRVVYENIKKTIFFMLSNSFAEIILIVGSILLKWPLPLTVIQILWTHLLCDGPEDIVLGFEPKENEVMIEGPKNIKEPILNKSAFILIMTISTLSGCFALILFGYYGIFLQNIELGRTMAFMAIAFNSIFYIISCRSFRKPFWRYENFWGNKWLITSMVLSFFIMTTITYIPPIQKMLTIVPLSFVQWCQLILTAISTLLFVEISKSKLIKK